MMTLEEKKRVVELGYNLVAQDYKFKMTQVDRLKANKSHWHELGKNFTSDDEELENLEFSIQATEDFYSSELLELGLRFNNAMWAKNKRLRKVISDMFLFNQNSLYFGTFTLSNDFVHLKQKATLEKYLKRILKSCCTVYVANADFGSKTNRLHFHAIFLCDDIDNLKESWKPYGFTKFELVKGSASDDDATRMAKYITKLTNHALKGSTKPLENKLIYSRGRSSAYTDSFFDN